MDQQNESQANSNEDWRNERHTEMLENGIGADVHFLVGRADEEKQLISAHKYMLAALSNVFRAQFFQFDEITGTKEGSMEKPIEVPDISPDAFRAMLCFVYANDPSKINKQNILDVYCAGEKYMIDALVNQCRQWLLNNGHRLDVDNVLAVLKFAQLHEENTLLNHCWTFVDKNAMAILKSEELVALDQHDLCKIFSRNNLIVDELCLFENLHRWAFYQCVAAGLEETANNMRDFIGLFWRNNRWHDSDRKLVKVTADGLIVTKTIHKQIGYYTNVRARQHVSHAIFAILPELKLVYYEVQMKKGRAFEIGWVGPNVPLNDNKFVIDHPGSFGIGYLGNYWESGRYVKGYGKGFGVGDVVGTGLLLTRGDHRLKLFFTLNGTLNGEPIVLEGSLDLQLFPAVGLYWKDTSVEANFGADPAAKPFMFDVNAHETELFG